ncbi:MAG: PAS domain-containing sensor histidine kinase [Deltaproteobacteria bacterium RBG_13_49_15]|nr:MAG: PAS domain-containing sensor histidine kinase [Deltaproteobacteria bacterium RBG_13_49_15]
MKNSKFNIRNRLVSKLVVSVGIILLINIAIWAMFTLNYQKRKIMKDVMEGTQRLSDSILLGTHYAMMLNSRDDINQIISNIGKLEEIKSIRIYNKNGRIRFSNNPKEMDQGASIKSVACVICHQTEPPASQLTIAQRTRIHKASDETRLMGIISPIYNEPSCSSDSCHVHPEGKKILGALDIVISLEKPDSEVFLAEKGIIGLATVLFLFTSAFIFLFVMKFVNSPINRLIGVTRRISKGDYSLKSQIEQNDEMGQLGQAINLMMEEIEKKQIELNEKKEQYQNLFEQVPCIITVQDRNFKLIGYNREFSTRFAPQPGDYCFQAYKGRRSKCIDCPVEKTFEDGQSHSSEEMGVNKDGTRTYWIVKTSPIKNSKGEIVAAMEMNLDITERKQLEEKLAASEKKYHAIFSEIPNPVFMLNAENYEILDSNKSVEAVYGYNVSELVGRSFMDIFPEKERAYYAGKIMVSDMIDRVRHIHKSGKIIYVNIRISPAEILERRVLLVTTSDITKRMETEQQLIQASKMATLGEMATGVAHELNQPLSVIKTASSYFMKKVKSKEPIQEDVLFTMSEEIDKHIDRAVKIINHMREFGRKAQDELVEIDVNITLKRAFEIFSQQLKLRGIEVVWETQEDLPKIMGDPNRLEQVFVNLFINARDAIEEKWNRKGSKPGDKRITLRTRSNRGEVFIEVEDTGPGISALILNKIFEPFFTTKGVGKGTGLGLSISYSIIKECGGEISAVSEEGKGAKFVIRCPITHNK